MRTSRFEFILFIMIVIGGVMFFSTHDEATRLLASRFVPSSPPSIPEKVFIAPPLEAKAVHVYDVKQKKTLYALNENSILPLASITKLMTALTAHEQIPQNTIVTIRPSDLKLGGDHGLQPDEQWRLKDLIDFMLVVSSNDGASAVAAASAALNVSSTTLQQQRQQFIGLMNHTADKLGLEQTVFANETGLDISSSTDGAGAYGSAKDVTKLFAHIITVYPQLLEATRYQQIKFYSLDNIRHTAKNTAEIINDVPGIIGSKTGLTDLAGGNLVIGFDLGFNHPIIITVLGSSEKGRFSDVESLASSTLAYFQNEAIK